MPAPVAISGAGQKGVSVGMSLSSLPSAPGAPSGHNTTGECGVAGVCASDTVSAKIETTAIHGNSDFTPVNITVDRALQSVLWKDGVGTTLSRPKPDERPASC